MLTRPLNRFLDKLFLRFSGGDTIRADELRMRATGSFLAFIMISYIPLIGAVALLIMTRPQPVNEAAERDQLTAIARTLIARDAVEAILLAGTDLTLLFDENTTDFNCIDCAAAHIAKILTRITP